MKCFCILNKERFITNVIDCACTKGVQALGSVKRLETIVLLWRYINKIELNWDCWAVWHPLPHSCFQLRGIACVSIPAASGIISPSTENKLNAGRVSAGAPQHLLYCPSVAFEILASLLDLPLIEEEVVVQPQSRLYFSTIWVYDRVALKFSWRLLSQLHNNQHNVVSHFPS